MAPVTTWVSWRCPACAKSFYIDVRTPIFDHLKNFVHCGCKDKSGGVRLMAGKSNADHRCFCGYEEAGCYCESRSPSSSSPQVFLPFDYTDGALRFRGNLTDDYLSLHVSWPGKRLRLEDE